MIGFTITKDGQPVSGQLFPNAAEAEEILSLLRTEWPGQYDGHRIAPARIVATPETAPTPDEAAAVFMAHIKMLAERFAKDGPSPFVKYPTEAAKRLAIKVAISLHGDDTISHLLREFERGDAAGSRAAWGHDETDTLESAAENLTHWAEELAEGFKREALRAA